MGARVTTPAGARAGADRFRTRTATRDARLDPPALTRSKLAGPAPSAAALFLLVLPNLLFVLLDRGAWISDPSWYGYLACRLHDAFLEGPSRGWSEMFGVPPKPPLVPWLGQLFVPLGRLLGNVDSALLLLPVAASYLSLLLLDRALRALGHGAALRWAGCLALAAAPVFVEITTQLYTQPTLLAAVCWLVLAMVRSREWHPLRTLLHLVAASATALLNTLAAPVFCVVPALVAVASAVKLRREPPPTPGRGRMLLLGALTLGLLGLTLTWYAYNHGPAYAYADWAYRWAHARLTSSASSDAVAYLAKLLAWSELLGRALLVPPSVVSWIVALAAAGWAGRKGRAAQGRRLFPLSLLGLELAMILVVFASADSQDYVYVLPVIPFVALTLAEVLARAAQAALTGLVLALLGTQWISIHLDRFGLGDGPQVRFQRLRRERDPRFDVKDLAARLGREKPLRTIVLATGTLKVHSVDILYHAAKTDAHAATSARYESLEFLLIGSPETGEASRSEERVWQHVLELRPAYIILAAPHVRERERAAEHWRSTGSWRDVLMRGLDLSDRIAASEQFERVALPEHPDLELYRPRQP